MDSQNLANILLIVGAAFVVAALIGGGLKAATIEFPPLTSRAARIGVALVGLALFGAGIWPSLRAQTVANQPAKQSLKITPSSSTTDHSADASRTAGTPSGSGCAVTSGGTGNITLGCSTVRDINYGNRPK